MLLAAGQDSGGHSNCYGKTLLYSTKQWTSPRITNLEKKLALFRVRQDENTSRRAGIRTDLRAQLYTAVVAIL